MALLVFKTLTEAGANFSKNQEMAPAFVFMHAYKSIPGLSGFSNFSGFLTSVHKASTRDPGNLRDLPRGASS